MKKQQRFYYVYLLLIVLAGVVFYVSSPDHSVPVSEISGPKLSVHFLDVGQADCILITAPNGKTMMIDAGNNGDADVILDYLRSLDVDTIDVMVGTHPHEDHIGGMDAVIQAMNVDRIVMPKVSTNTKTFYDVLKAVRDKGLKVNTAKAGMSIPLDPDLQIQILSPKRERYESLNDYSVVIRLTYRQVSFMLMGDLETLGETELLESNDQLQADILKVGHHGSSSSTSARFLKAVAPQYGVISVGAGNRYGHPNPKVLERLEKVCQVLRTDRDGHIIIETDGENIAVRKMKE
ncbi:MAG TPA: ComEC/Rec2 family competence protein [Bacillota bacterium]|nr:ComEC/Rec2 family competence protein [Bacillota bacterium]